MKTSFWTKLLDLISPRVCVVCGKRLSAEQSVLCTTCHLHLPFTDFALHPTDNPMARLFWGQFHVEKACALFYYEPQSEVARILYSLKYHDRPDIGYHIGRIAATHLGHDFFDHIDALVPVPLARERMRQRGYNQSEEIARGISELTGIPIYNKVVIRNLYQGSQTTKSLFERRHNVEGVFQLIDGGSIAHKHLLLIDDVVTTGSTVTACATELQKSQGTVVSVFSLGFTKSL